MRRTYTPGETLYELGYVLRGMPADDEEEPKGRPRTRFVASTDNPDRYDDIVDQASWQLERFRRNPVAPWGHDYSVPPVGRVVEVGVQDGQLLATIEWDTAESNPLGRLVASQYAEGFLSAVSVGFRPGRSIPRKQLPKDEPRYKEAGYGMVYYDCELLEISAVVIPANADALAAKGLPAMRLTAPEVREEVAREMLRLLREDAEVRGLLDERMLDVVDNAASIRKAQSEAQQAMVLAHMFGFDGAGRLR